MDHSASRPVVCQLVHGLPVGGTEVLVDRLVRRMANRCRFVIACLDEVGELGERLVDDGFHVHRLGRRPGFDWACVRRLGRWLDEQGVELVHAHQYTPFAYAAATRVFGWRPRLIFTEHGRFFPDTSSRKRKLFNRVMTSRRDRLVAVGNSVRQALIDKEGLPAGRIAIVYNGVDFAPLTASLNRRESVRRDLGVADDEFLVLQVARLDAIKDHATAIRAMAAAVRQHPRMRLLVVGDGPEAATINRHILEQGLQQQVTMLGQRRDVPDLLAASDAFLLTSVSEGIPVTIIEAMAARLPVVSTEVGGVPELITHGETGLLAPVGDAMRLANALLRLARSPAERPRIADLAYRNAAQRFSEDQMVGQYSRIYAEALDASKLTSVARLHGAPEHAADV